MDGATDVLVIGAGAAGLAATAELARAGRRVDVLEARDRVGGRIFTVHEPHFDTAVELGAEFIHGKSPLIWDRLRAADLRVTEVDGDYWCSHRDSLAPCDFFGNVDSLLAGMTTSGPDRSFREFLDSVQADAETKRQALAYVSGFHAARTDEISVHSLVHGLQADAAIEGDRAFRIVGGYDSLVHHLVAQCDSVHVQIRRSLPVREISWRKGEVTAVAESSISSRETFTGRCALITVPLGVLQRRDGITFSPPLGSKQEALRQLAMGEVIRVTLRFRQRFWASTKLANLAFLFSDDDQFPTWWTLAPLDAPVLTGWAPSHCAAPFEGKDSGFIIQRALATLARLIAVDESELTPLLEQGYVHDWQSDPFARGAYSYVKTGGEGAQRALAEPIDHTLFFAGEATDYTGHHGTVHGAIASGLRAAAEMLRPQP